MEAKIAPMKSDVVTVTSEARPTEKPVKTSFSEVLARGAGSVVGGAEAAMTTLPGTSMMAVAVRGGVGGATALPIGGGLPGASPLGISPVGGLGGFGAVSSMAEGPGATPTTSVGAQFLSSVSGAASATDPNASLQQSEQSNLYYLQLQQQVNQQSQTFEALSNVMKSESDTVKNAIGNMH
jgi:hypothetical protein